MKRIIFLVLIVLSPALSFAQQINIENVCTPVIDFFDKTLYHGANQNWEIVQSKKGYMYFSNSSGLLEFDGFQWKLYQSPTLLRCIAIDPNGIIYGGMQNDFGYWKRNINTRSLEYHSLTKMLKIRLLDDEIWKIVFYDQCVYFNSFHSIFIYNTQNNSVSIINAPTRFQFLFRVGRRLFVQEKTLGLMELTQNKLSPVSGGEILNGDCVYGMTGLSPQSILISTIDKGLFVLENKRVSVCRFSCNDFLKKSQIFTMTRLTDGNLAFGTILNGLLISDSAGNIISSINKPKGLPNNTILSMREDQTGNLWLGLDNGICYVHINSPVYSFVDVKGVLGSVYQQVEYNHHMYFATNQGLFFCPDKEFSSPLHTPEFTLMPQTQGQAWKLQVFDNRLYCYHNKGLYVIDGSGGRFIFKNSGINSMIEIKKDIFVLLTYSGMYLMRVNGRDYQFTYQNFCPYNAGYLAKDQNDYVYFGNNKIGLMRVKFDKNFDKVAELDESIERMGVANKKVSGIYSDGKNVYILDSTAILKLDLRKQKFVKDESVNRLLPPGCVVHNIELTGNEMWCFADDRFFCIADYDKTNPYLVQNSGMKLISNKLIYSFENITRMGVNNYMVCTSSGFDLLKLQNTLEEKNPRRKIYIRDIGTYSTSMESLHLDEPLAFYQNHAIRFPHNHPTIYIRFTLPEYAHLADIHFSYRLKGFMDVYSLPSGNNIATFTKLPPGTYVFQVRATIDGLSTIYTSDDLMITILPPWYEDWSGFIFWLIIAGIIFWFSRRYLRLRWENKKRELAMLHEREIEKVEKKLLEEKLKSQNDELKRVTDIMIYKSNIMTNIDSEIEKITSRKTYDISDLRDLKQFISRNKNPKEEIEAFEVSFNKTYDNYLVKLRSNFPQLSKNDLILAAYIRMNLTSKEIADLMHISEKSVEIARYRLRKKLNLEHGQGLAEFLLDLK